MTNTTQQKFVLRFESDNLKEKVEIAAKKNRRSINSELLHRLDESFNLNRKIIQLQKQAHSVKNIEVLLEKLAKKSK